jgi:hypothetical protein
MCDLETPIVLHNTSPIARKQYRCCECRTPIPPRTQYDYVSGIWSGGLGAASYKTCLPCAELRNHLMSESDCVFFGGGIRDALWNWELDDTAELLKIGLPPIWHQCLLDRIYDYRWCQDEPITKYDITYEFIDWRK